MLRVDTIELVLHKLIVWPSPERALVWQFGPAVAIVSRITTAEVA